MSKAQTDNDEQGFSYKVSLRIESIQDRKDIIVLDTFHGHGAIWSEVKKHHSGKIKVIGIDKREDKSEVYLKGDNEKFILNMDLNRYDLIDIDAYGSPFKILDLLFMSKYRGIVHATFIQSGMGRLNNDLLTKLGFTKAMVTKCPTLFSRDGFGKLCDYLALNGVKTVNYLGINRKFYLYFKM